MKKDEIYGILIMLILWELLSRMSNNFFIPNWWTIILSTYQVGWSEFVINIGFTMFKTVTGFLIGNIAGIAIGTFLAANRRIGVLASFGIDFMRSLPSIVVFPLFMILFGINDTTKVLVTSFGVFWIVIFNTIASINTISASKIKYLKIHGSSNWEIVKYYIIFALFQNWLTILKITLNLSLFITIVLEMFIGSEYGIGKALTDAKNYYEIPLMYFYIVIAGLVGYGLNKLVNFIESRFGF
jgi:ABC-type nitrate/sulfonate/bicarbonate transport system permease component